MASRPLSAMLPARCVEIGAYLRHYDSYAIWKPPAGWPKHQHRRMILLRPEQRQRIDAHRHPQRTFGFQRDDMRCSVHLPPRYRESRRRRWLRQAPAPNPFRSRRLAFPHHEATLPNSTAKHRGSQLQAKWAVRHDLVHVRHAARRGLRNTRRLTRYRQENEDSCENTS